MSTDAAARPATPELERQSAVMGDARVISEFLDWLSQDGQVLGRHESIRGTFLGEPYTREEFVPTGEPFQRLLERYFEIDPDKIEAERRALLEYLRPLA